MSNLGPEIQDCYHYLLSAGGEKLEDKYGHEAHFATERTGRSLANRLRFLLLGSDKLAEIKMEVGKSIGRVIPMPSGLYDPVDEIETVGQIETYAGRGLKMLVALARRLGIDPNTGESIQTRGRSHRGHI